MYIFYADESGFSKGGKLEPNQPITVFAGVLIDRTKLFKALRIFDDILAYVNKDGASNLTELKFSDIKQAKHPYRVNFPKVDDKADLLEKIITDFQHEISFKVFYSAINDRAFFALKKSNAPFVNRLSHPYLAAAYRVISQIQSVQQKKRNNKGKTFFILDEQSKFQTSIEELVARPIHIDKFSEVIDTAYFGKSHYSRLLQIADLIAGIVRFHLTNLHLNKPKKHFNKRVGGIFNLIVQNTVFKECFQGDLIELYRDIETKNPQIRN